MENQFCEIIDSILDHMCEVQQNENCGILGNDDVNLYKARDLARKYGFKKITELLSTELAACDENYTAEEYVKDRNEKFKKIELSKVDKIIKKNNITNEDIKNFLNEDYKCIFRMEIIAILIKIDKNLLEEYLG